MRTYIHIYIHTHIHTSYINMHLHAYIHVIGLSVYTLFIYFVCMTFHAYLANPSPSRSLSLSLSLSHFSVLSAGLQGRRATLRPSARSSRPPSVLYLTVHQSEHGRHGPGLWQALVPVEGLNSDVGRHRPPRQRCSVLVSPSRYSTERNNGSGSPCPFRQGWL